MKKRIFKTVLLSLLSLILALLPIISVVCAALVIPPQHDDLFTGVLDEKYDRLMSIDEEKIVVVGGSSVAFGLDSALLEKYTSMPVVNFGLYAALGTKLMLDLSREGIKAGDIVVISPELSEQTMSLYFNAKTTLEAADGRYSMLADLDMDNKMSLLGSMFEHAGSKLGYYLNGAPNPEGVYNSSSFNEYGDISYPREGNVMDLYYDPELTITLDQTIIDREFIDYLNSYIKECKQKGAEVYFSFCPMNVYAMWDGYSDESLENFRSLMDDLLDCEILGYADEYVLPAGYFYDSNFHLNDVGARYRTMRLAENLLLALGIPTLIEDEYPEPPALAEGMITLDGVDENQGLFTYERLENGNYMITGLTAAGKALESLTIPRSVEIPGTGTGIAVTAIGEGAFSGASAKTVIIPSDSPLRQIRTGAFAGASSVSELVINVSKAENILPPQSFSGTSSGFKIIVPKGSSYKTDYYWSQVAVAIEEA